MTYKSNDIVYLDTGDYEFVLVIDSIEDPEYIIRNGIYREKEDFKPDVSDYEPEEDQEMPIIITEYKKEDDIEMPVLPPPDYRVPEWRPVSIIYPYYEDKDKFDREPLSEITRMATYDEGEALMKIVGYHSSWKENL